MLLWKKNSQILSRGSKKLHKMTLIVKYYYIKVLLSNMYMYLQYGTSSSSQVINSTCLLRKSSMDNLSGTYKHRYVTMEIMGAQCLKPPFKILYLYVISTVQCVLSIFKMIWSICTHFKITACMHDTVFMGVKVRVQGLWMVLNNNIFSYNQIFWIIIVRNCPLPLPPPKGHRGPSQLIY